MINRLLTVEMSFKEFYRVNLLRQDVVAVGDHLVLGGEEAEQLDSLVSLPLENRVMLRTNQRSVVPMSSANQRRVFTITWTTTTALSTPSSSLVIPHLYTKIHCQQNIIRKY